MFNMLGNKKFRLSFMLFLSIFILISCAIEKGADITPPVITLNGASTITLVQGTAYVEAGATASDDVDGAVNVTITGTVDVNTVGDYTINYSATDSSNNTGNATRTVIVTDLIAPDTTPPVITLNGESTVTLMQGTAYVEAGATATDNVDTNINVITTGNVDINTPGNYIITYTATDSVNNIGSVIRTVIVTRLQDISPATYTANPTSGVVALTVSFSAASQAANIVSYQWDFGDSNSATGSTVSHVFNTAGTYITRLTVTDSNGVTTTTSRNIYAFNSIDNSAAIIPADLLFHDKFDYSAGREDTTVVSIFQSHGWTGAKTEQDPNSGNPRGYMYTTDTIPGFSGSFPGANSTYVLAMEALPTSMGNRNTGNWGDTQSSINLRFGSPSSPVTTVPANVWFQFWVYPTGGFDRGMKFIYPCKGFYPCQDLHWLFGTGTASKEPLRIENGLPAGDQFMMLISTGGNNTNAQQGNEWKLGQQDDVEQLFSNRWTLVKIHIDTSGSQGSYEAWLKPINGQWVKVAEWIGGTTAGFTWPISNPSGHRQLVMPGTVGTPAALDPLLNFDSITYLDDFSMANSEDTLPQYPY